MYTVLRYDIAGFLTLNTIEKFNRQNTLDLDLEALHRQLHESQQRTQLLLKGTGVGVWTLNFKKDSLDWDEEGVEWDGNMKRIVGVPLETEMSLEYALGIVHPDDYKEIDSQLEKVRNGESDWWDAECRIICYDNSVKNILSKGAVKKDDSGKRTGLIGYCIDISESKKLEQELAETVKNLERSNRDLEQFAYIASHDLQEPLRMVATYVQMVHDNLDKDLDDDMRKYICFAVDGAKRMKRLVNDLLDYSRIVSQGREFEPVDVNEIFEAAMLNAKDHIDKTHAVIVCDSFPHSVKVDSSQLLQVFQNLLSNAIKFSNKDNTPHVAISAVRGEKEWIFSVKDNGIGIDKQYEKKIFVMFRRLNRTEDYAGTGIGLAMAKKIIERHEGRIWFDSETGVGSTFYFSIPD